MDDIVKFLRQAVKTLNEMKKQHVELRKSYLEELAEAIIVKRFPTVEEGTSFFADKKEKQLKQLANRESARIMHRRIRKALKRDRGGGISRFDVPDASALTAPDGSSYGNPGEPKTWKGPWRRVTEPSELEQYIIKMNVKQYNQAVKTPFGQEPLASLLGPDGTTEFATSFFRIRH